MVSKAYAGSGALKTDFTRTGKRSLNGLVLDGQNSLERYFSNRFFDVTRQVLFPITARISELIFRMHLILFWEIINLGKRSLNPNFLSIIGLYSFKLSPTSSTHQS